ITYPDGHGTHSFVPFGPVEHEQVSGVVSGAETSTTMPARRRASPGAYHITTRRREFIHTSLELPRIRGSLIWATSRNTRRFREARVLPPRFAHGSPHARLAIGQDLITKGEECVTRR